MYDIHIPSTLKYIESCAFANVANVYTPEFAQIYNAESAAFVNAFNVNFYYDVHEFWADGFYRYYDGERDALPRSCPQLYAYIENTVNSLC